MENLHYSVNLIRRRGFPLRKPHRVAESDAVKDVDKRRNLHLNAAKDIYSSSYTYQIMSGVILAERYSPGNYPGALNNLVKRYQRDTQPVHYTEAGFGEVSEDQASTALRFFAEIGLLENPKGANYVPPESVVTWQRKMGPIAEEAKEEVRNLLTEYEVFEETLFVLEDGEQKLESLAEQVGGLVGIDEDELTDMKRTLRVFVELGFLEIDAENVVSLPDSIDEEGDEEEHVEGPIEQEEESTTTPEEPSEQVKQDSDGAVEQIGRSGDVNLNVDLDISLNATEMDPDDLERKVNAIRKIASYDES